MRMHSPVKRYMLARPVSLAVAWAVALALCGTESTLAQDEEEDEPIVLVSNTEEDADAPTYSFSIREIVQYFTTGSNAAGYGLTSIDFAAVSPSHPNDTFMTFSLHRHREGSVWGPTIATLPDAGPIVEGTNTFTLSARLAPNTEYALSIREQAYHVTLSRTSSHDEDSDHGWTLANDITEILFAGRSHKLDDGPLHMKIRGHVLEVSDPGRPAGLTATASDGGIDLSWTAPEHDGGREISGYRIEVSSDGGASWSDLVADTGNAETTYRHAGLATGDIRHYRVSAVNAEGTGSASDVATATLYLVSNADQDGDGRSDTSLRRVQRFTAGAVATGLAATDYKLTEVELESVDYEFDDLSVAVYAVDQDGSPDELHASLTGPDTPRRGTLVFAAQSDTTLVAGTTYALVIESPGGESVQLATTTSHSEDAGSAAGWSLADGHQVEGEDDVWRNATPTAALRIAVRGFELTTTRPPPPPAATATAAATAATAAAAGPGYRPGTRSGSRSGSATATLRSVEGLLHGGRGLPERPVPGPDGQDSPLRRHEHGTGAHPGLELRRRRQRARADCGPRLGRTRVLHSDAHRRQRRPRIESVTHIPGRGESAGRDLCRRPDHALSPAFPLRGANRLVDARRRGGRRRRRA